MQGSRFTWFVLLASAAMGCGQGGADEISAKLIDLLKAKGGIK